jgi:hypothetical protein
VFHIACVGALDVQIHDASFSGRARSRKENVVLHAVSFLVDYHYGKEIVMAGVKAFALAQLFDDGGKLLGQLVAVKIKLPRFPVIAVKQARIDLFIIQQAAREAVQRKDNVNGVDARGLVALRGLLILAGAGMQVAQVVAFAAAYKGLPSHVPGFALLLQGTFISNSARGISQMGSWRSSSSSSLMGEAAEAEAAGQEKEEKEQDRGRRRDCQREVSAAIWQPGVEVVLF